MYDWHARQIEKERERERQRDRGRETEMGEGGGATFLARISVKKYRVVRLRDLPGRLRRNA